MRSCAGQWSRWCSRVQYHTCLHPAHCDSVALRTPHTHTWPRPHPHRQQLWPWPWQRAAAAAAAAVPGCGGGGVTIVMPAKERRSSGAAAVCPCVCVQCGRGHARCGVLVAVLVVPCLRHTRTHRQTDRQTDRRQTDRYNKPTPHYKTAATATAGSVPCVCSSSAASQQRRCGGLRGGGHHRSCSFLGHVARAAYALGCTTRGIEKRIDGQIAVLVPVSSSMPSIGGDGSSATPEPSPLFTRSAIAARGSFDIEKTTEFVAVLRRR